MTQPAGRATTPMRLRPIDGLRGLAAIAVVAYHFLYESRVQHPALGHPIEVFRFGAQGVQLFFVISGFVIMKSMRRGDLRDFVASRVSRILPTYVTAVLLTSLVVTLLPVPGLGVTVGQVLVNLTMLQSYVGVPHVDGVYWTLAIELAFYVQAALLWYSGALAGRRFVPVLFAWVAVALCVNLTLPSGPLDPASPLGIRDVLQVTTYVPWFVSGIVALQVWEGRRQWSLLLLAAFCTVAMFLQDPKEDSGVLGGLYLLIVLLVTLVHPLGTDSRPLQYLGRISYALYLIHQVIGIALLTAMERAGVPVWLALGVATVVAIGLAEALTRFVERPLLRPVRRLVAGRRTRDADPTRGVGL